MDIIILVKHYIYNLAGYKDPACKNFIRNQSITDEFFKIID